VCRRPTGVPESPLSQIRDRLEVDPWLEHKAKNLRMRSESVSPHRVLMWSRGVCGSGGHDRIHRSHRALLLALSLQFCGRRSVLPAFRVCARTFPRVRLHLCLRLSLTPCTSASAVHVRGVAARWRRKRAELAV
jgi:hypothetical protein